MGVGGTTWDSLKLGGCFVLVVSEFVQKGKRREVWSVLEHLHAGLQLRVMYLMGQPPKYRLFHAISCHVINRSPGQLSVHLASMSPILLSMLIPRS